MLRTFQTPLALSSLNRPLLTLQGLHVTSAYSMFQYHTLQEANYKGAEQTARKRRLVCALLFACNKIRFSCDDGVFVTKLCVQ